MSILGDDFDQTVKRWEGYVPRANWDYAQYTNGWGTRARYPGEVIGKDEAQRRYDDEIAKAHGAVTSFAPNLDAGTTKALTDLTFNAGTKWQSSGLGQAIRAGDLDKARSLYTQYVNAGGKPLPGLIERRQAGASWIGAGGDLPKPDGQNPMAALFPWNMVQWPTAADPSAGDLNRDMQPGPLVQPQPGMPGMFASIPPQDGPQAGPPLPPMRGPEGGARPPMPMGMGSMANGPAPQSADNSPTPNFIQRMSMNPLVLGGIMTALDASRGGSGVEGFKAGAGTAAGIQDAWMKNYALRQQIEKEKAVKGLLASGQGIEGVPAPLIAIAKATGDISPVVQHLTKQTGTDDIKEYEYAVRGGFQGSFQQWMEKKKNMAGEYAKQLVYGTNEAGDIVPMQAGSKGDLTASKLPPGVKLQRDPIKMDAGTHFVLMDPTTRTPIGMVPKNIAEVERQKGVGDAQGKAQGDLPAMESIAKSITDKIEAVAKDPYLDNMVGYGGYLPNVTPQARTLQAKIEQLKGQAFLQAFQSLKGAGAITEMEGAKATAAMARLQEMVQSGQDYREALKDFKDEVARLVELKRTQARGVQGGGSIAAPLIQPPPMGNGAAAPPSQGGWSIQRVD